MRPPAHQGWLTMQQFHEFLPDISCYRTLSPNPPKVHTGVPSD